MTCPKCRARPKTHGKFWIKKGRYIPKHDHQPVQRYKCKLCGTNFSARTFSPIYRQHKPWLNEPLRKALASSVTFRRSAVIFGVARNTVVAKFIWIAQRSRREHLKMLAHREDKVRSVEFDEMETYQASRLNMLSISMAVDSATGDILHAKVARMRPKGRLAQKYPNAWQRWNVDNRRQASEAVLKRVASLADPNVTVSCDGKRAYSPLIKAQLPNARLQAVPRFAKNGHVLSKFNHVAAKIRADLARMRRRTWACTRKWQNLQHHLYLYIGWNNRYNLAV